MFQTAKPNFYDFLDRVARIKTDEVINEIASLQNKPTRAKPFVKWVGGKRSVIKELVSRLPSNINNYYEPFVGGGALFFEIFDKVNYSYLSDLNIDLIIAYDVIKKDPTKLIELLEKYKINHCEDYYYKLRKEQDIEDPVKNTARLIYLLKTCFNGLYRVNKKGEFNTPIGSYKNPNIADRDNLLLVNKALQKAKVKYQDFTKITPKKGDFVYFDPPYHPTDDNSFIKWHKRNVV